MAQVLPQAAVVPHLKEKQISLSSSTSSSGGFLSPDDGYVHGPNGVGGDEHVDKKATSFISLVKERVRLEEMNITNGSTKDQYASHEKNYD